MANDLAALKHDIYDKFKPDYNTKVSSYTYDVAFICVPSPYMNASNVCDISEVEKALIILWSYTALQ